MASHRMAFHLMLLLFVVFTVELSDAYRVNLFNTFKSISRPKADSTTWAVLVAGSNGYFNYRHQADVCHAYQILKKGGLKDENIIVFMYDDIANYAYNPRPGVIINSPNGSDVYAGVPKVNEKSKVEQKSIEFDYTGDSVSPENFFAVLLGNKTAVKGGSGKVVASKPKDRIFVFYSDHGGPGVLGMPHAAIYANDFIDVLKKKHASGTYDEMVIYVEACESGSIFEGLLPKNLNIYVTTASNATEDSYATYCPPLIEEFSTCLGDLYSVSWMEDRYKFFESNGVCSGSRVLHDFQVRVVFGFVTNFQVKKKTLHDKFQPFLGSHVTQYGTLSISNETVSLYQGSAARKISTEQSQTLDSMGVIDQRNADLYSMWHEYNKSTEETQQKKGLLNQIKEITAHRAHVDSSIDKIKGLLLGNGHGPVRAEGSALVDDWDCLKFMVRTFETYCGPLTQYGLKHTRTFANICNNGVTKKAMDDATKKSCISVKLGQWDSTVRAGYNS
ncbi:legumain-like [Bidens hawaiensis]|uniref:legumain-like n=1 Tax=Bidens hawaiensis TaxID=980011 RepID=UPI004049B1A6